MSAAFPERGRVWAVGEPCPLWLSPARTLPSLLAAPLTHLQEGTTLKYLYASLADDCSNWGFWKPRTHGMKLRGEARAFL